jgi:hypothetical protein
MKLNASKIRKSCKEEKSENVRYYQQRSHGCNPNGGVAAGIVVADESTEKWYHACGTAKDVHNCCCSDALDVEDSSQVYKLVRQ